MTEMEDSIINIEHAPSPEERGIAFEQYKIIFDSINQLNTVRETSNQFWIVVNTVAVSGISYLKGLHDLEPSHRTFLLITLLLLGCLTCGCWIQYLWSIKSHIEIRFQILKDLEVHLPMKAFIKLSERVEKKVGIGNLTIQQIFIPAIFIAGYIIMAVLLFIFPSEVIKIAQ